MENNGIWPLSCLSITSASYNPFCKSTESLINEETILIRRVSDIHGYKSDLRTLFFYSFFLSKSLKRYSRQLKSLLLKYKSHLMFIDFISRILGAEKFLFLIAWKIMLSQVLSWQKTATDLSLRNTKKT